jgi:hypothetical protein
VTRRYRGDTDCSQLPDAEQARIEPARYVYYLLMKLADMYFLASRLRHGTIEGAP